MLFAQKYTLPRPRRRRGLNTCYQHRIIGPFTSSTTCYIMFPDSSQIRRIQGNTYGNRVRHPLVTAPLTTPRPMEGDSEDDDEGALGRPIHFLPVYVCLRNLRLFYYTPLFSIEQHHVESPFLTVRGERSEIPSSGSDSEPYASELSRSLLPLVVHSLPTRHYRRGCTRSKRDDSRTLPPPPRHRRDSPRCR